MYSYNIGKMSIIYLDNNKKKIQRSLFETNNERIL
jgi:hypothetical protein